MIDDVDRHFTRYMRGQGPENISARLIDVDRGIAPELMGPAIPATGTLSKLTYAWPLGSWNSGTQHLENV